jgi:uncharacterized protein with GYD domain
VEQQVRKPLLRDLAPVDLDAIAAFDERVQLSGLAVHRHAAGLDQLVGLAPRRDAGPGEEGVQTHRNEKIGAVPHYVTLMKWTSQGRMGLPAWRDRVEEGERTITEAGGSLVGVWVTLGQYDVVEVFEAPSDEIALEIITKLQRHGAEETETLRAFTRDEAEEIIRRL